MSSRTVALAFAALLGIIATAAVAWSASRLAGQHIGLSAEPLSVARGLAPSKLSTPHRVKSPRHRSPARRRIGDVSAPPASGQPSVVPAPASPTPSPAAPSHPPPSSPRPAPSTAAAGTPSSGALTTGGSTRPDDSGGGGGRDD